MNLFNSPDIPDPEIFETSRSGDIPLAIEIYDYPAPVSYRPMWHLQQTLMEEMIRLKRQGERTEKEYLLLLEHLPVLTLGRHGHEENLLLPEMELRRRGIECIRIERGGDITYHGPGQLIAYPLIDLEEHHIGVKAYVDILEESVIRTLSDYGVKGERVEGASGVWIGKSTPDERKICAVGVKCSRFVTMHGIGFNINTDLSAFSLINPCGFTDKGVTSLAREVGHPCDMAEVKSLFASHLLSLLGFHLTLQNKLDFLEEFRGKDKIV